MGQRLTGFYDEAARKGGGLLGRTRLAMKTALSYEDAKNEPDSPELIAKFEQAMKELFV